MIDLIKTYIIFVVLSKWNKIPKEGFELLDNHWSNKPQSGLKLWLYNKIKSANK
jgi:hypothetical protein